MSSSATSSSQPLTTDQVNIVSDTTENSTEQISGSPAGSSTDLLLIIGLAALGLIAVLLGAIVFLLWRRKRRQQSRTTAHQMPANDVPLSSNQLYGSVASVSTNDQYVDIPVSDKGSDSHYQTIGQSESSYQVGQFQF